MKEQFEEVTPLLPGDKVLRRRIRHRRRLRITPDIPEFFRFLKDIATKTPLIPMLLVLSGLWLLFSGGVYLAEQGVNEQFASYGHALWWSFATMQTMGANNPGPITTLGMIIGSIWAILGTVIFFGMIIASLYAYFMLPRRRPSREIISTIQYNLGELESLSADELMALRETTVRIVDAQISKLKEKTSA
ncbi:ion channel [Dehalococcoidales bacterium]|nr:ion channel [Dehalococcoidales bacterium]MCL0053341.1 ion channel [Dehalococcoidales bacterium]MCL0094641.1 ion channel [Dehalococcoidales bacterium]